MKVVTTGWVSTALVRFLGRTSRSFTRPRLDESSDSSSLWFTTTAKSSSSSPFPLVEMQESSLSSTILSPLVTDVNNLYSRDLRCHLVCFIFSCAATLHVIMFFFWVGGLNSTNTNGLLSFILKHYVYVNLPEVGSTQPRLTTCWATTCCTFSRVPASTTRNT